MPGRSHSTTSERELVVALAQEGRIVTLANLAGWRKEGLLPALASQGLGTGKGRAYYWNEPEIVAHACATFDLLRKYGRPETVLWMLWLHGFAVPIAQFRRAWAARSRNRMVWTTRLAPPLQAEPETLRKLVQPGLQGQGGATQILLRATLALSANLVPDDGDAAAITRVVERALAWISRTNSLSTQEDDRAAEHLWLTVRSEWPGPPSFLLLSCYGPAIGQCSMKLRPAWKRRTGGVSSRRLNPSIQRSKASHGASWPMRPRSVSPRCPAWARNPADGHRPALPSMPSPEI